MTAALIVWAGLGLGIWWWLLRRTPGGLGGRVFPTAWGTGETLLAGLLGLHFLLLIVAGGGPRQPITAKTVQGGLIVYGVLLGFLLAFLSVRKVSPGQAFGLAPPEPWRVVALGVVGIFATYPLVGVTEQLTGWLGYSVSEDDGGVQYLRGPIPAAEKATMVALALVAAPLAEEFIFRGLLYGVLKKHFGTLAAMGASALLFAAIHQNVPAIPALFVLAVGFTLVYEVTGSLWAPVVMHVIFNAISVVTILFFPEWIPKL